MRRDPQPNPYKPDWTLFWVGTLLGCCIGYAIAVAIGNGW